jgi:hypothetical protein
MAVRKITCGVRLGDPTEQLAHARQRAAGGDESWGRWVEEYEAGDALILTLDVAVILDGVSASPARVTNRGVWIEKNIHAPLVAGQVQQAVTKDFNLLAARLSEVGGRGPHRQPPGDDVGRR